MERLPDDPAAAELFTEAEPIAAAEALIGAGADMRRLEFLRRLGRAVLEYDVTTPASGDIELPPPEPAA
jgi:hypothetical protein